MTKKITQLHHEFRSSLSSIGKGNKPITYLDKGIRLFILSLFFLTMMMNGAANAQCLTGTAFGSLTPACTGAPETITTCGYGQEYSTVTLSAGMTYTFASSVGTDICTISDPTGVTALAFGTGTVTYTPGSGGAYRFYTHLAGCLAESVCRTKTVMCTLTPCTAPTNQATSLVLSGMTASTIPGSFAAAAGAPSGYLVVRYLAGATPTAPVDGTTYATGAALGTGTVVQASAALTFTATGLLPSTSYDIYVYSYNVTAGVCSINYLQAGPLFGNTSTTASVTYTSTALGGLWNSAATWVGGVIPTPGNHIVIAAGSVVTVDVVINVLDLTIDGVLQWNGTANIPTINGNVLINAGGRFLPHTSGLANVQCNFGGNFTNNGYANLAYCVFNTVGASSQSIGGSGTFQADGSGKGIIRQIACSSLNTVTMNTTQNMVVVVQIAIPNNFNPNGKLSIDNTACIYGQSVNVQVENMVVTNMGTGYTGTAPVAVASGASRWLASTAVALGNVRFSGGNQYVCTIAGTTSASAPVHTSGTAANGTATFLWVGSTGKIGNAFALTAVVGTQYFYNGNLYTCVVGGTASAAAPPIHSSGTVLSGATVSYLYVGTVATCTMNWDVSTGTARSLTMTSPGSGYSSAPVTTIATTDGLGSGATVTNTYIQQLIGNTTATCGRGVASSYTTTFSAINNSQGVGSVTAAAGGVNYTVAPLIGFAFPTSQNLVTAGGSGFTSAPTVTVTGGTTVSTGSVLPTFTVTVNQGKVVSVYCTGAGSGWLTPPTLSFTGGGGTGATLAFPAGCLATATAIVGANRQITGFTVTNAGTGYIAAPVCLMNGGTFTTAASTAPLSRVGLYNVVYNWYAPVSATGTITEGNELAPDRRMNNLNLTAVTGVNMSGNVTLTGTAPLTLTNGLLDMAGNNILCTWNSYAGLSTISLLTAVTNASMTLTGRGGGTTGSTWNYPFIGGNVSVFTGSGTDGSNGSSILTSKVTRLTSPSGGVPGSLATGKEAFRVQPGASEVYGLNPTVSLRWNTNDTLTIPGLNCFVGQSTALSGPTWTIRSASVGGGALAATGTLTTATSGAGPFAPTGDDYFSFVTDLTPPTVASFTPAGGCANASIITITGTGFSGIIAGNVTIGGTPVASIVSFTSTEIVAQVGAGTTGLVSVTTAGGVAVSSGTFTVGTATVSAPILSPVNGLVCTAGGSVTLNGTTAGAVSYSWTGAGLSSYVAAITNATPSVTTQYTSIIDMGTCVASFLVNVGVISGAGSVPSATPPSSCYDPVGVITLNANLSGSSFGVSSITFAPVAVPGSGVTTLVTAGVATPPLTSGSLDDGGWSTIPLGFTYNYFGNAYSTVNIGTNGVLQFGAYSSVDIGDYTYAGLPNVLEPANIIAPLASDLYFTGVTNTGSLRYWNDGIAPTRRFIVQYTTVPGCCTATGPNNTLQLILYETTGVVEVHVTSVNATNVKTIGLQDLTRLIGATAPGRNGFSGTITTPEAWRFNPPATYTYLWNPAGSTPTGVTTTFTGVAASVTPYYDTVTVTNPTTGCVTKSFTSYVVNSVPSAPSVSPSAVTALAGDTTNFTASGVGGATFSWHSAASGGTLLASTAIFRSTSCTSGSNTFYAQQTSGICVSPTRTPVTLTINPLTIPTAISSTECSSPVIPTCSVTATNGIAVPKFNWYSAASGGTLLQTGTSSTYLSSITTTTTFYVSELNGACESPRVAVTATLPAPLAVVRVPSTGLLCAVGDSVIITVTPSMGGSTLTWTGGAGLSTYSGATTIAKPSVTTLYTVTEVLGGCSVSATVNVGIIVGVSPTPTATPNPVLTCRGPILLSSGLSGSAFSVSSITYAPIAVPGSGVTILTTGGVAGVTLTSGSLDDGGWGAIPIGFSYDYLGTVGSTLSVGTNGVVQFGTYDAVGIADYTYPLGLPSVAEPHNIIAGCAVDLYSAVSGTIKYWTDGSAPTRRFVVDYNNVPGFTTNGLHTFQIILYETTGIADVQMTQGTSTSTKTIGTQDGAGLVGATAPGRNAFTGAIGNEAWRFTPPAAYTFTWTPSTGLSSAVISNPVITSFSTPGTRTYTVSALNTTTGCSTSGSLSIVVNNLAGTVGGDICSNQSYFFNGVNLNVSGTYLDTLTSFSGCDSIVTLNLNVRPVSSGSFAATICAGASYSFNGLNRTTTGAYLDTLINLFGCDSVVTLNLTVRSVSSGSFAASICAGASYSFNGLNRTTSGAYLDTLTNVFGCDSFITLNLTVRTVSTGTINASICSNQYYLFNSVNLNTTGVYYDTLINVFGCDSFVTLNLTVRSTSAGSFGVSICSDSFYRFNGINRSISGAYLDTLPNSVGCDSVVTLNLIVYVCPVIPNDSRCAPAIFASSGVFIETALRNIASTNPDCDTFEVNTVGAGTDAGEVLGSAAGSGGVQHTVWYTMTAPTCAASSIRFSTNTAPTNFDTRLTAYHRVTPSICSSGYIELASNNDAGVSPYPSASTVILTPGSGLASSSTYGAGRPIYVQVSGFNGASGDAGVIVDVDAPDLTSGTATSGTIPIAFPPAATAVGTVTNIYLRYRLSSATGGSYAQKTLSASVLADTIRGLTSGVSYDIWAMYRCAGGDRWVTKKLTITTAPGCSPPIAGPTMDTSGGCTRVAMTWSAVPLATRYAVYWRPIGYAGYSYRSIAAPTTTYLATGLFTGTTYEFWTTATCVGGAHAMSPITTYTTCGALPRMSNPEATEEGVYSYNGIEYHHMPISEISTMIAAENGDAGEVKLTKIGTDGEETTPVTNFSLAQNLSIYPNPAQTEATISYLLPSESDAMTIKVYDVQGKEMTNELINEPGMMGSLNINLSKYAGGVYFVKVQANNFSETRKLVVDKE